MDTLRHRLGIVMPLANEEASILGLMERVLLQMGSQDCVFCILDGVCKDRTKVILEDFSAKRDPRVVVVWAPENRCVVDAYFRGYRAALEAGCLWILEMDGGLSHLPEQIPQFISAMEEGYDYVGGSRYLPGGKHDSPWTRILISRGGSYLARIFLGGRMTDMTSGFECFTREAMTEVLEKGVQSRANFFQTEIKMLMMSRRWKEVPICYSNDKPSVGRSSLRESFRILFSMWLKRLRGSES